MKTKTFRIGLTLAAILTGVAFVALLSLLGKESRGPLKNLFHFTSETVSKVETNLIIEDRSNKRSDKLKWFQPYIDNPQLIKTSTKIMLGAYDNNISENFESIINLEDSLKTTFPFIHIYTSWGNKAVQQFPSTQVESILKLGSIPVITWEPWLSAFDGDKYSQLRKADIRDKNGLRDVANGVYDFYLKTWIEELKQINGPVFLRMAHEMNDPYRYPWGPHNNSAKDFIAAWQHVHNLFAENAVTNVFWIWSPHPAYGLFKEFYPGDAYVDYVGVGTLNYGTVANWSKWWSFKEIFGNYYPQLSSFKKPIILTEFGSLTFGGKRNEWFSSALDSMPKKYPMVKALLFFHFSQDNTTTQQTINWYFKDDTATTKSVINAMAKWQVAGK